MSTLNCTTSMLKLWNFRISLDTRYLIIWSHQEYILLVPWLLKVFESLMMIILLASWRSAFGWFHWIGYNIIILARQKYQPQISKISAVTSHYFLLALQAVNQPCIHVCTCINCLLATSSCTQCSCTHLNLKIIPRLSPLPPTPHCAYEYNIM
jgi:hypothetical protein